MCGTICKNFGWGSKIYTLDRSNSKLELASKKCGGADYQINIRSTRNLVDKISVDTDEKILDVIIDCVGTDKIFSTMLSTF
ncbi:MAG TPA: zinc-binding dehydrogenase [Candidatus Saccharimonadales bacterium]|nr:zinc-binding dehydrogenase [Candidatus Saccharimonadales bacterium]